MLFAIDCTNSRPARPCRYIEEVEIRAGVSKLRKGSAECRKSRNCSRGRAVRSGGRAENSASSPMTSSENAGGHCGQRNCAPPPCVEASVLWAQLRLRSPRPTATAAAFAMYGSRRPRPPTAPWTLDAGLAMVTQGMAWWYRAYAPEQTPEARGQYEF